MKSRLILFVLVAIWCTSNINAFSSIEGKSADPTKNVPMKGEFSQKGSRRASEPDIPVVVYISNDKIYIEFTKAVGAFNIVIDGELKETGETAQVGEIYVFSLDEYEAGEHLLEVKNPLGGFVYGEFTTE